jgi:hypothetical protein
VGLACFLFFAAFHHGHFRGTDEMGLLQTTRSLYDGGSVAVPRFVHTGLGADGRHYSHFSIGQSALALPFFALGRLAEVLLPEAALRSLAGPELFVRGRPAGGRVEIFTLGLYGPVVGAILVAFFFLFERALGVSLRCAVVCALLFGATTYVATQSTFFLRHTTESAAILGALHFFFVWKEGGRRRNLWIASTLASLTLLVRLPAAVVGPVLAAYAGWCLWVRGGRRVDPEVLRRALPAIAVPLGAALALSAYGDVLKWGVPWNIHQLRTASSLHTPLYVSLYGFLLSPGLSVFVYSPLLLLAPWALRQLWRERRAETLVFLGVALTFLLVFSRFTGWTGLWSAPGPRYQLVWVGLLLLPLGLWLDRSPSRAPWLAVGGLAALGLFVQLVLMSVRWGGLIEAMGYRESQPRWAFLFLPDQSPVLGAARLVLRGEEIDLWIRALWLGWPGQEPAPGVALGLAAAWAALLAATLLWIGRGVRVRRRVAARSAEPVTGAAGC